MDRECASPLDVPTLARCTSLGSFSTRFTRSPRFADMTVSLSHVHVLVDDPDAALLFYRDTLGLEVKNEVANDGFRWITLTPAAQPEI